MLQDWLQVGWETVDYLPLFGGYFVCLILAKVCMRKGKEICACVCVGHKNVGTLDTPWALLLGGIIHP